MILILIAEDSQTQRVMLEHLLQEAGYPVLATANGKEALEAARQHKPRLIISDVVMPEMDGLALCKALKVDETLKDIPIMLMTSLEGIEEIGHGLESGADHFMYKPYDSKSLLARIETIFMNQTMRKEGRQQNAIQIIMGGQKYQVNSGRGQILELLVSSVEDTINMNKQLKIREAELQMARQAADQANHKKSRFLASMSHEIRTPMTGILGLLELLSLSKLDADQHDTLMTAYESGKSLLQIIDDILDFSKIEAGKLDINSTVVSINDIIKKVYNLYSGAASRKGLVLTCFCSSQISPAVLVDPLRLQQILSNFLSNAIKFTAKGCIEIRADWLERTNGVDRIRFSVKDSGIGISKQNQQLLFQPFVQVNDSSLRDFGGTGLGLVICRLLADKMSGSVEIESEIDQGTTMSVTLSLLIADPDDLVKERSSQPGKLLTDTLAKRRAAPSVHAAEKENTLVLVVDDHPVNRNVLIRQLNALGYAAEGAEGGVEALEMLKSRHYALIMTDCNMPEMDGYTLARNIRAIEHDQANMHISIIACTANALGSANQACMAAGMDDCLIKPVVLMDLMHLLDHWLPIPVAEPINRACLAEIVGNDEVVRREILMDFKSANDKDVVLLVEAVKNNDWSQVTRMAHRIKGACQLIGANDLGTVCQHIEEASSNGDATTVNQFFIVFEQEVARLKTWFESLNALPKEK